MKNRARSFFNKYCFLIAPIGITAMSLYLGIVSYLINDDTGMQRIALSFQTNEHSEHLVFISVVFGYLLKILYHLIPTINWYAVLYLVIFTATICVLYKILYIRNKPIILCTLSLLQIYVLTNITFTSVAFLCSSTGMLLFVSKVDKLSKSNIKYCAITFLMLFVGFAMRNINVFFFTILMFIPLYVFGIIKKRNTIPAITLLLILCIFASYSLTGIENYYNKKVPEATYYAEFQEYRAEANDGGTFNYSLNEEKLKNAGISRNDYMLYYECAFGSKEVFNNKTVKAIADRNFDQKYQLNPIKLIKNIIEFLASENALFVLAFLAILLISLLNCKKSTSELISIIFFTAGAIGYLFFRRRALDRVIIPIIFIGILILLTEINRFAKVEIYNKCIKEFKTNALKKFIPVFMCVILPITLIMSFKMVYIINDYRNSDPVIQYMEEHKENVFIGMPIEESNSFFSYSIHLFTNSIPKTQINYDILGTSHLYSHYWYNMMEQEGLSRYTDESISALLDDRAYFVYRETKNDDGTIYTDEIDSLCNYFYEHKGLNVKCETVKSFDDSEYTVFQFRIQNQ